MANKFFKSIKTTFKDMTQQMKDGEIRLVASSLAFSTLLSIVPFLAVTLTVFKEIGGLEFLYPKIEAFMLSSLQHATSQQTIQFIQKVIYRIQGGAVGTTGAIALVLTSLKLVHDMDYGINRVWNIKDKRPFLKRIFLNVSLFLLFPFVLAIYVSFRSLSFFKPVIKSSYGGLTDFIIIFVGLFLLYKVVPYIRVRVRPALVSAALSATAIIALKSSFAWLATKAFTYSKVYGSLAALPLLCLWLWWLWYIVLGGVAFCASTQKRRWLDENYGFQIDP